jgi:hypothetical protein
MTIATAIIATLADTVRLPSGIKRIAEMGHPVTAMVLVRISAYSTVVERTDTGTSVYCSLLENDGRLLRHETRQYSF